jgi:hypothetical protein
MLASIFRADQVDHGLEKRGFREPNDEKRTPVKSDMWPQQAFGKTMDSGEKNWGFSPFLVMFFFSIFST